MFKNVPVPSCLFPATSVAEVSTSAETWMHTGTKCCWKDRKDLVRRGGLAGGGYWLGINAYSAGGSRFPVGDCQ